ncbi:MAG: lyase family protein [Lacisediminihabitans sp.]
MTSTDDAALASGVDADFGLLSPQWVGTPVSQATSDAAILEAIVDVEVALVTAYEMVGIAPVGVGVIARSVVESTTFDVADIALRGRAGGNPVIPLVKDLRAAVAAASAEAAVWVHRGATSQDILDTAMMLVAQRAVTQILADAEATIGSLSGVADSNRRTIMAARTLTQHAVPTSFGLKAAGWLGGVSQAARRLAAVPLPVQWGGAGGTQASFVVVGGTGTGNRLSDSIALTLGLAIAAVPWQTQRAPVTSLGDALVTLSDAFGTISSDVLVMARPEIGELSEPTQAGRGGSSAMPQKHNPILSVLVQSAARKTPALAAELHRSANAVDERPAGAWHVEWQCLRELLRQVGGAAALTAELVAGLVVYPAAMLRNLKLSGPLLVSERIMLEFGPIIGAARVQELIAQTVSGEDTDLAAALRAEPGLCDISDAHLSEVLYPVAYLGDVELLIDRALAAAGEDLA